MRDGTSFIGKANDPNTTKTKAVKYNEKLYEERLRIAFWFLIKNVSYSAPHEGQVSINELPCNSASFSLGIPDRRWRPSMF